MFSNLFQWLKRDNKPLSGGRRSRRRVDASPRLRLEHLEDRVVPAFNLTIGSGATANVLHDSAGHFTATASGANISVQDIRGDLLAGKSVTVSNGSGGTETGNITWQSGSPLDINGIGTGRSLTIAADLSTSGGATVAFNSAIQDSDITSLDNLSVAVQAQHDLTVSGSLSVGHGALLVQADAAASGSGTLTLASGASVGAAGVVTLRGADLDLQPSSHVSPTVATNIPLVPAGFTLRTPQNIAFDAAGNLYVANEGNGIVSKVTPQGKSPPSPSGSSSLRGWPSTRPATSTSAMRTAR